MMLPVAAMPLRVCLLEDKRVDPDCCSDCDRQSDGRDPCCMDVDPLPDSQTPQPLIVLPPVIVIDLPETTILKPVMMESGCDIFELSEPIRGPTSPAAYRAVLGVWRM
jgi:hypothetical protein